MSTATAQTTPSLSQPDSQLDTEEAPSDSTVQWPQLASRVVPCLTHCWQPQTVSLSRGGYTDGHIVDQCLSATFASSNPTFMDPTIPGYKTAMADFVKQKWASISGDDTLGPMLGMLASEIPRPRQDSAEQQPFAKMMDGMRRGTSRTSRWAADQTAAVEAAAKATDDHWRALLMETADVDDTAILRHYENIRNRFSNAAGDMVATVIAGRAGKSETDSEWRPATDGQIATAFSELDTSYRILCSAMDPQRKVWDRRCHTVSSAGSPR